LFFTIFRDITCSLTADEAKSIYDYVGDAKMRIFRAIALLSCLVFASVAYADSVTVTVTSGTAAFPGHSPFPFGFTGSAILNLTPNVSASFGSDGHTYITEGTIFPTSPGSVTFVQTITVNGISTNVTTTDTLVLAADGCQLIQTSPAISVTTNLGALGLVDVNLPILSVAGVTCTNGVPNLGTILVVPGEFITVLQHDVPRSVPEPSSLLLSFPGFLGLGLYGVRPKLARSR
jgi:hypothetical protein